MSLFLIEGRHQMNESYNHLVPEYRYLMEYNDEKRIESLDEHLWINYPKSDEILQLLGQVLSRAHKKPRVQGLLIIGESNIGKTSVVKQFLAMHKKSLVVDEEEMTHASIPVVYALTKSSDERDLYIGILERFFTAFRPTDPLAKLRHQALSLMRECQVKMLILDEIQNLLRGTSVRQHIMMDAIKNLSNELMIPIVGVGTKDAALILATDPQHTSRFDIVRLSRWELDKNFRGMVAALEKRLPLKKPSALDKKEKATLLYNISRGNLGDLHRLLIECTRYAIQQGSEEITEDIIVKYSWLKPTDTKSAREILFASG